MTLRAKEAPKRVLILDEEPFIRDTLKLHLAGAGLFAQFADDEFEAREALKEDPRPAAIILDILHSKLNAYRFLQRMRSQPALAALPVVILTFKEKDPETAFTYNVWAQAYLSKPFVPQEVVKVVAELVEHAGRPAAERF